MTLLVAGRALTSEYFRHTVVPADLKVWASLHRGLRLSTQGRLLVYRGLFFYGFARMTIWFLYARLDARTPFQAQWGGPAFLPAGSDVPMPAGWRS